MVIICRRPSVSYRYTSSLASGASTAADRAGLPPKGQSSSASGSHTSKYQRTAYYPASRIAYSPQNYTTSYPFAYGPTSTLRSRSTSSVVRRLPLGYVYAVELFLFWVVKLE